MTSKIVILWILVASFCTGISFAGQADEIKQESDQNFRSENSVINNGSENSLRNTQEIIGCTDPGSCNYDPSATFDDGTCEYEDDCGVCFGDNLDMDCNGECFGDAMLDECGTCDSDPDNDCVQDCFGDWGGLAILDILGTCGYEEDFDDCGVLAGDNLYMDCNGECFGTGLLDECGTCDDDPTNDCVQDCMGDWGGFAILDVNGTCGYEEDFDECSVLAGGDLDMDCNSECFGTAYDDMCGNCVEGSTGFVPCTGQADLYFGDIDYQNQTIEIRLNNGAPVYGFQFQIFGDTEIINLGNPSGGSAENANYMVSLGGENRGCK